MKNHSGSTTLCIRVDNCSLPVPVLLILGDPVSCCGVPAVDSRRVRGKKAHRRIGMAFHRSQGLSHLYQIIITELSWATVTLTLNPPFLPPPFHVFLSVEEKILSLLASGITRYQQRLKSSIFLLVSLVLLSRILFVRFKILYILT